MRKNRKKRLTIHKQVWYISTGIFLGVASAIKAICDWSVETFNVSVEEILFTLTSPLKGTEATIVLQAIGSIIFPVSLTVFLYLCIVAIDFRNKVNIVIRVKILNKNMSFNLLWMLRRIVCCISALAVVFSLVYLLDEYGLVEYIQKRREATTIYEDYYVEPKETNIRVKDGKRNVICIYLESMENAYASIEDGGGQEITYIPNLVELTKNNISFSNTEKLGGFHCTTGTYWTMAGLLATTSGIPFSFPTEANAMSEYEVFAGGLTTLGDILEEQGYKQVFLCGSDAEFGGRKQYFEQHGNYEIFDLYTAREEGYIAEDYYEWWGFEDKYLFDIAKDQLLEFQERGEPFNLTMLTVDTHPVGGYVCSWCEETYEDETANVVACTDKQVYQFIEWCKQQEFYENTTIILVGDHLRMDTCLMNIPSYDRTVYNCFLNPFTDIEGEHVIKNRIYTTMDIFPTILAAMGFEWNGDRLGLGTNMFSGTQTIAEEIGYGNFNDELMKYSQYYLDEFK